MEKFGKTLICCLIIFISRSLGKQHFILLVIFVIGMTFLGKYGNSISLGGFLSSKYKVSKIFWPFEFSIASQPTTYASCLFVIQSSVASLFLIMIGIPKHSDNLPAK